MATIRQPRTSVSGHEAPKSSARFDWIMVLVTLWGIAGLFDRDIGTGSATALIAHCAVQAREQR
jgi:hypothetical protein